MEPVEILMAEDNRGDVTLVREAMSELGLTHHVNVARDGVEAVDYLHRRGKYADALRPDLIVLDLKLPRKSGHEVLDDVQLDPELCDIPVVILSSSRSELEVARARRRSAYRCLVKPSTFAGYVDLVRTVETFRQTVAEEREKAKG